MKVVRIFIAIIKRIIQALEEPNANLHVIMIVKTSIMLRYNKIIVIIHNGKIENYHN